MRGKIGLGEGEEKGRRDLVIRSKKNGKPKGV
jgi:hypothetical protein